MKEIYILLTKSDTLFSKAIYRITRAEYTHASISLDRELTHALQLRVCIVSYKNQR